MKSARPSFFVLIALVGGLAIFSSTLSKTPVLPLFAQALDATPAEIGWIVMASTIPGILISYPAGALSDQLGKRRVLLASLVVFATAPFLYLIISTAWQLMAVRFYHGFATAIFGTVASAAIAERYTADRAQRLSTYSSVTIVGRSVAPFLGGTLISLGSFGAVYIACAISGVLALVVGLALRDHAPPAATKIELPKFWTSLATVLRDRGIMLVSLVEAAQYLVFGAIEAFLALFASSLGIPAWQIGVILGVQLVSIVFAKPIAGKVSDRLGRRRVILPGLMIGAASVALLPYFPSFAGLSVLSLVFGLGFATVTSSTAALVADLTRDGRYGSSMGVLRTIMDVGQSIGPVLTGFLVGAAGYPSAFTLLAAILVAAAVLLGMLLKGVDTKASAAL
ncbi:major facilitator superfamily protein [Thiobacillus denitrificans ATCC 25259]|uniref:Major facilitator superfamily protein n=1 Tax=Thiobacillus denitrificans (strain ATCC 25259 / T1) TaxID=292415 RepID=Q3SKZ4_THIDA|nr:MFS transporter [Thiobacillus denitrificans]AAZ96627.1 major facilitator superfamily protein [Thiobacillus denitrificans ATCC 25259]